MNIAKPSQKRPRQWRPTRPKSQLSTYTQTPPTCRAISHQSILFCQPKHSEYPSAWQDGGRGTSFAPHAPALAYQPRSQIGRARASSGSSSDRACSYRCLALCRWRRSGNPSTGPRAFEKTIHGQHSTEGSVCSASPRSGSLGSCRRRPGTSRSSLRTLWKPRRLRPG